MKTMTNSFEGILSLAATILLAGAGGVAAQASPMGGDGVISVELYGGNFMPTGKLNGRGIGSPEFSSSAAIGGAVGYWPTERVGVRANLLRAQTPVSGSKPTFKLHAKEPTVWLYSGDVLFRFPVHRSFNPYALGGLGFKTYDFDFPESDFGGFIESERDSDFTLSFGGGLEYRFGSSGRWGVNVELKNYFSSFGLGAAEGTQNDVVGTGGLSVRF